MYNILWLDDDFIGPDLTNDDDAVNIRREGFLNDVRKAKKHELNIDSAKDIDEFKTKFAQNPGKYQAVILDIMDLNPNDATDESALMKALKIVNKSHGVLAYVYSNNPDKPGIKDYIEEYLPIGHSINKAKNVEDFLYSKIVHDLSEGLHYFTGHEECLELLNKGYLNTQNQMKTILKNIKDDTYMPYNDIRQILENMLETLVQSGIIPKSTSGFDTYSTFNKRIEYITKQCPKINNAVDWNNPCVPYSDCRHEIKWVLDFLGNISNRYSHYLNANPHFLLSGELLEEYSTSIRKITYDSFFVAMKWYLGYMTNKF